MNIAHRGLSFLATPAGLALGLVAIAAVLYLPWLGHTDLVHEETRRAVIARTMMETGEYLVPYLADEVYLSKPPLFNWMIAATSIPAGTVTELTARLPSVISLALLAVLMVSTAGQRLGLAARWLLGLGVLVTGELIHKAVIGNIDVAFTLLVSASLWTWFMLDERGRRGLRLWLPPAVLVAAAFLAKREPGLVFHYLGIGAYLLSQGRFRELFRPAHLAAAAVTAGLILVYLVPTIIRAGPERYLDNFREQVVTRGISGETGQYVEHIASYPLEILVAALPLSVLLVPLAWPRVRRLVHERHGRMLTFAALVVAVNLPVYWLRADAAVRHFAAMLPSMAVIGAMVFDTLRADATGWSPGARRTLYVLSLALLALAATLAGAAFVLTLPGLFPSVAGPILSAPLMALLGVAALAGLVHALWRYHRELAVITFVGLIGFGIMLRLVEMGYRTPYEAERIVREHDDVPAILDDIRERLPTDVDKVQAVSRMPHAVWFYDRQGLIVPAVHYERDGRPASAYLIAWQPYRERLEALEPGHEVVAELPYQDGNFFLARIDASAPEGKE